MKKPKPVRAPCRRKDCARNDVELRRLLARAQSSVVFLRLALLGVRNNLASAPRGDGIRASRARRLFLMTQIDAALAPRGRKGKAR